MHSHVKYLYLPSVVVRGEVEFFRLSGTGGELIVERLEIPQELRRQLSEAVTQTGFTTLGELLAPHNSLWKEVGRGDRKSVGNAISIFAEGNPKP